MNQYPHEPIKPKIPKIMKKLIFLAVILIVAITNINIQIDFGADKPNIKKTDEKTPLMEFVAKPIVLKKGEGSNIQVALLLDTSNSMDGLIDQAKSQLGKWSMNLPSPKTKTATFPISKSPSMNTATMDCRVDKDSFAKLRP